MSWLGDVLGFEQFKLGNMWDKLKEHPERALIGAMDEFGTKAWNKVLGKDWEPLVDKFGGATTDDYDKARAAGINIGPGRTMHGIASTIAGAYAGGYGADKLGLLGNGTQALDSGPSVLGDYSHEGLHYGAGGLNPVTSSPVNASSGLSSGGLLNFGNMPQQLMQQQQQQDQQRTQQPPQLAPVQVQPMPTPNGLLTQWVQQLQNQSAQREAARRQGLFGG